MYRKFRKRTRSVMKKLIVASTLLTLAAFGTGCSQSASFSLLPSESNFQQAGLTKNKIDILWVVDNSGSMDSSQQNLAANIQSFVTQFNSRGYDYQMAVTTTDAYKEYFGAGQAQSKFRDGTDQT